MAKYIGLLVFMKMGWGMVAMWDVMKTQRQTIKCTVSLHTAMR